jgi:hypothetical protein
VGTEQEEGGSQKDAIEGEQDEAMVTNPLKEPLDDAERDEERYDETDDEDEPAVGVHEDGGKRGVAAGGDAGLVPEQEMKIRPETLD